MTPRLTRLRRPLAALFAAAAAGLALPALRPAPPPSVRVPAAARDLPAGKTLTSADLHHVDLPPAAVPSGALRSSPEGRVLATPMRKNEPLTDARVLGEALLKGYAPGTVATPVRIADAAAVRLLHPGDHIDVLSRPSPSTPDLPPTTPQSAVTNAASGPRRAAFRGVVSAATATASPLADAGGHQRNASLVPPTGQPAAWGGPEWGEARIVVSGVSVVAVSPADEDGGQDGALIVLATDRAQALALAAATPPLSLTITGQYR
ncbi:SAF domain-containing protein [Actinomadura latina]|uniref:Flagellar biosynthesis protein FlgA n=1 Tax=Actinomadura latina TaxID=163603 RepID=A0A846Z826_9ACTN|nr:SAF domain-containing protein [Actinomadura latina]NKZ06553.1 flagellar biosynthesis protein FlgA [Actinomadura latina]